MQKCSGVPFIDFLLLQSQTIYHTCSRPSFRLLFSIRTSRSRMFFCFFLHLASDQSVWNSGPNKLSHKTLISAPGVSQHYSSMCKSDLPIKRSASESVPPPAHKLWKENTFSMHVAVTELIYRELYCSDRTHPSFRSALHSFGGSSSAL